VRFLFLRSLMMATCGLLITGSISARELTFEDRIQAQRAIEETYWSHRTWPQVNPSEKPSLESVLSDDAIRARVEDTLKKSAALEKWWHRPLTPRQLQAEMDRMAKQSRDPKMLHELFDALGNDPLLIAETLVRSALADRLVRNWYATDGRFHGALRAKVLAARALCSNVDCMKAMGGHYSRVTSKLGCDGSACNAEAPDDLTEHMDASQWKALTEKLAVRVGGTAESLRVRTLEEVEETDDAFCVTVVLSQSDETIVTATTTWPKESFDAWWSTQARELTAGIRAMAADYTLPSVAATSCANNTWGTLYQDFPDPRYNHSAIWTGTEMIVWGGNPGYPGLNTGGRYNPATDTWTMTSIGANVPVGRGYHTAVWTGTEMIIWGGYDEDGAIQIYMNSGGRYNPVTDTWMPTSAGVNVPGARYRHTAIWTGTEMIVWGGTSPTSPYLNSGGRYDPSTDTWSTTSMGAAPSARSLHTAVWTGSKMLIWGGRVANGLTNSGGRYDPSSDTWTSTSMGANAAPARDGHTSVWTGSTMIVWGGRGASSSNLNTGGRYDPLTDTWTSTSVGANVPTARYDHTAVWTESEMIVWGGSSNTQFSENTGGRYDPATDQWLATSVGPNAAAGRTYHTAVWTGNEMIIWGGWVGQFTSNGGRYDPATNSWTPTSKGTVPLLRTIPKYVWTGTELIVCGTADNGGSPVTIGGRYLPSTDSWLPMALDPNTPTNVSNSVAEWSGKEMLLWGGSVGSTGVRYNPTTNLWTRMSSASVPASRLSAVSVWTGTEMIVWGGYSQSGGLQYLASGGRYNPSADQWLPTSTGSNLPAGRRGTTAVWTGTHMIVWGGENGSVIGSGGRYAPATDTWSATSTTNAPTARASHTAIWTGNSMIVWGGSNASSGLNSGGRYDPMTDAWTPTSTGANVPTPRPHGHSAVWTGAEMIVWGGHTSILLNTGGRYNPTSDSWTTTSTGSNTPGGREFPAVAFTGREMILWGGLSTPATGGRYCACPDGVFVYRDLDGDGRGDPTAGLSSCDGSAPPGYVTDHTDCNDTNAAVHPGAIEVCNGLDDDCDGAIDTGNLCTDSDACTTDGCLGGICRFTPVIVPEMNASLAVSKNAAGAVISWTDAPGPFNVYRGTRIGPGWVYNASCLAVGTSGPETDAVLPGPGISAWYLVSRTNACGESVLGRDSSGGTVPNPSPCP